MNCRSCGGTTVPVCDLGKQPLANALLNSPDDAYDTYPLELLICESCHLGQLKDLVPPEAMFKEYVYYTSVSGPSVNEAAKLVARTVHDPEVRSINTVVEIGSNDGYLLQHYRNLGIRVLGVDPARGPADHAISQGIPTVKEFFTLKLAHDLPRADVIHANNVLAHVPDLNDFVAGLAVLLNPYGTLFVEVPYFGNLLEKCEFDTIYHEHSYYFSVRSLLGLFRRHNLYVMEVEFIDAHGGSLRLRVGKHYAGFHMEEDLLFGSVGMQKRIDKIASVLKTSLNGLCGRRVWGFGAAAKATVRLNYCGIDNSLIQSIADDTPAKVGKFIPGTGINIAYTRDWLAAQPDYTCIFAWNYAAQIASRYAPHYNGVFFTPYDMEIKEKVA